MQTHHSCSCRVLGRLQLRVPRAGCGLALWKDQLLVVGALLPQLSSCMLLAHSSLLFVGVYIRVAEL